MNNQRIRSMLFKISVAIFLVCLFTMLGLKMAGMSNQFLQFPAAVLFVSLGMTFGLGIFDAMIPEYPPESEEAKAQNKEGKEEPKKEEAEDGNNSELPKQ